MRRQLDDFVTKIRAYTGADTVGVVSHSLGVTGVRAWMDSGPDDEHPKQYGWVDTFIGCAGANHGTYTCGPNCEADPGTGEPCAFISPGCRDEPGQPLYDLNHPDEPPRDGGVDYYTIWGSADYFYVKNPESPRLEGALSNVVLEGGVHNATRASEEAINLIYQWATDGEPAVCSRAGRERVFSCQSPEWLIGP